MLCSSFITLVHSFILTPISPYDLSFTNQMSSFKVDDGDSYAAPEFRSFRPLFTLQPVLETREKQLKMWRDIMMDYCTKKEIKRIIPSACSLFTNESIERRLSSEGISAVVEYLLKEGNTTVTQGHYVSP
jgi:hypothetical protein